MDKERKKSIMRWTFLGVVFAIWIAFIWSNSLTSEADSSVQSWSFLYKVRPILNALGIPWYHQSTFVRKFAHVVEFAVLGGLLYSGFVFLFRGSRNRPWRAPVCALLLTVLFGAIDECIQIFIPGRGALVSDVFIDGMGGILGISFLGLIRWIRAILRKRRGEHHEY